MRHVSPENSPSIVVAMMFKKSRLIAMLVSAAIVLSCGDHAVLPDGDVGCAPDYALGKGNTDWEWHKVEGTEAITTIAFNGSQYMAARPTHFFKASGDGRHWKNGPTGPPEIFYSTSTIGATFVSVGEGPHAVHDTWTSSGWRRQRYLSGQDHPLYAVETIGIEVSRRERNTQIIQMAILQLAKAVAEGQVKMTLSDLDKLIRLEAYLNDEPESRQEIIVFNLKDKSDKELKEIMRREMMMLQELPCTEDVNQ
jgi:hypothetical protein